MERLAAQVKWSLLSDASLFERIEASVDVSSSSSCCSSFDPRLRRIPNVRSTCGLGDGVRLGMFSYFAHVF